MDYELKDDGLPTTAEQEIDDALGKISQKDQRPLSSNCHSIFNLRHYYLNGGRADFEWRSLGGGLEPQTILIKAPWVEVCNGFDTCKLCKRKSGGWPTEK